MNLSYLERDIIPNARYFLLELDPNAGSIIISGFRSDELMRATNRYTDTEKKITEAGGVQFLSRSIHWQHYAGRIQTTS
jgi:hypothetical protein